MSDLEPFRVIGQVIDHAQLTLTADPKPEAVLSFEIQMPIGLPVRVIKRLGTNEADHIAARTTQQLLRRGAWVAVHAEGAREQSDHGTAALRLFKVGRIYPIPNPAPQTEATTTQEA